MDQPGSSREVISAKTGRTGFLHLPNEIRNRIYEEVIWCHDREAVLLPRKLPRRVRYNGERITDSFTGLADPTEHVTYIKRFMATEDERFNSDMACLWTDEKRPAEEVPLPVFTEESTDDETEIDEATNPDKTWYGTNAHHKDKLTFSWLDTREIAALRDHNLDAADICADCGKIYCVCIDSDDSEDDGAAELEGTNIEGDYDEDNEEVDDEYEQWDDDGYLIPPEQCFSSHPQWYGNGKCHHCAGFGLGPDQDAEAYVDSETDNDDPLQEDDEHLDSEERMGMLFSTEEPSILLACREIRDQCLPLYYGSNAFSWRFFWLDQNRSFARFEEWTKAVGENAKYITRISFEGRHSIEEGIEFEVDIDLLEEAPYFDLAVDCIHPGDELTDVIEEAIEQDFITALWKLSKRHGGVIKLTSTQLCQLGTLFSEALQRDPGIVGDPGAWDGKLVLGPR